MWLVFTQKLLTIILLYIISQWKPASAGGAGESTSTHTVPTKAGTLHEADTRYTGLRVPSPSIECGGPPFKKPQKINTISIEQT